MRRRRKIKGQFLELFRYYSDVHNRGLPLPPPVLEELKDLAKALDRAVGPHPGSSTGGGGFIPDNPQIRLVVQDASGHTWILRLQASSTSGESHVSHEDFPVDPRMVAQATQAEGQGTVQQGPQAHGEASSLSQSASPLWVRIPQGQAGQEILHTIARLVSPTGTLSQDGLHALLNSPQFQQLFQGSQLAQGATRMLSTQQLVGILLPPSMLAANPEAAKALLIAQGLPAQLIQGIPDQAVSGALQALLQTSQTAGHNPLHFLQTIASALTLAGIPVQEVQNLLLNLLQAARAQGIAGGEKAISPEVLQQLAAKMMATNNPQLLGLNQMVQQNFGQGLAQIFNSFIRVFLGGALMQGQQMWPQVVPNERMLAELGALFGTMGGKLVQEKTERRRGKKQARKEIKIDDPAFRRVERKDDVSDETPQQEESAESLESIFIEMDE